MKKEIMNENKIIVAILCHLIVLTIAGLILYFNPSFEDILIQMESMP